MKLAVTAVAAALTVSLLPAAPAAAAVTYGAGVTLVNEVDPVGTCLFAPDPGSSHGASTISLAAGGGSWSALRRTASGAIRGGGSTLADVATESVANVSFTTSGGALTRFAVSAGVSARFPKTYATTAPCADNGLAAVATATSAYSATLPVRSTGWLDVSATVPGQVGADNQFKYEIRLIRPGGSATGTVVAANELASGTKTSRVYVPAGSSLRVNVGGMAQAELQIPDRYHTLTASGSISARGTFSVAGAAATAARGPRAARKQVVLPGAVSCAGTARVKVTKAARLRAKRIAFAVNGRVVKRVKKFKKRPVNHAVRVPTAGPITVRATIFQKKGKKRVKVTRSYTACR